jgi:hypothetical protein
MQFGRFGFGVPAKLSSFSPPRYAGRGQGMRENADHVSRVLFVISRVCVYTMRSI